MKGNYRQGGDQESLLGVTLELAVRPNRDVACRRRPRKKHSRWRDPRAEEGRCVRKTDIVALDGESRGWMEGGGGKSARRAGA